MSVYWKALVITTLIMEIASIFSLTVVWIVLTALPVPAVAWWAGFGIAGAGLCLLSVRVYRLALASERNMLLPAEEGEAAEEAVPPAGTLPPNHVAGGPGETHTPAWVGPPDRRDPVRPGGRRV